MRSAHSWGIALLCAAALTTVACGGESPLAPTSVPNGGHLAPNNVLASSAYSLGTRDAEVCDGGVTYVGPIRLPISVHGTTVILSWLGSDCASRGYELEFQRYDVSNTWLFAMHDTVTKPEAKEYLGTEGTYRVRVRGLFTNDQVGGWTDWVVFSTDDTEDHTPALPPVFCATSVTGCFPPPPPPGGGDNGHCDGDHNNDGHNDCGDNGNPPDNPGDGNNGGGNGNGNDNPGPPPGVGGPPPCVITPTAHGDHPSPGDDHNNDGHNDCGVGNENPHGN